MDENFKKEGNDMKSYNGLYDKMISGDNIQLALLNAGRNKYKNNRRHKKLRKLRANPDRYIDLTREMAVNFVSSQHKPIEINDGISAKKRHIIVQGKAHLHEATSQHPRCKTDGNVCRAC